MVHTKLSHNAPTFSEVISKRLGMLGYKDVQRDFMLDINCENWMILYSDHLSILEFF